MDVKTAFLNGSLEEKIYMDQPEGFSIERKEHLAYKLKKSIYGLNKLPNNGTLSSMILLHLLDLKKTLLIGVFI